MAQTIQILRTTTNTPPPTLLPGALSAELGTQTKLWIGAAAGNRLLLSTDPTDITLSGGAIIASAAPNAMPGSLWWDSNIGQLYIRYFDGNSTAWVSASTGTSIAIPIAIASGGTGATAAPQALINLGALPVAGGTMTGTLTANGGVTIPVNYNLVINTATIFGAANQLIFHEATHAFGSASGGATFAIFDNVSTRNASGAWAIFSDASMKQDVTPYTRGLDAVLELNPVQFRYMAGTPFSTEDAPSRVLFGLIAEDVKPHVPEIVGSTMTTIRGKQEVEIDTLEPGNLIYACINAIKELNAKVEALTPAPGVARR